jgi:hypothetical protein
MNKDTIYLLCRLILQTMVLMVSCYITLYLCITDLLLTLKHAEICSIIFLFIIVSIFTLYPYPVFPDPQKNMVKVRLLRFFLLLTFFIFHGTSYWVLMSYLDTPVWGWWFCIWLLSGSTHILILGIIIQWCNCSKNVLSPSSSPKR